MKTYVTTVLVLALFRTVFCGQLCGKCKGISQPSQCKRVVQCNDHDTCAVEKYDVGHGHFLYDMDCASSLFGQKRNETVSCLHFCNDLPGCNIKGGLCGAQVPDTRGKMMCYSCPFMTHPNDCEAVVLCDFGKQCSVTQFQLPLSSSVLYESGCKSDCPGDNMQAAGVVGKRSTNLCKNCCSGKDLCNTQCSPVNGTHTDVISTTVSSSTTTAQLSPAIITFLNSSTSVQSGSDVTLVCRAAGNPTPNIVWSFKMDASSSLPSNVYVTGTSVHITHFKRINAGDYGCGAQNSVGNQFKAVTLTAV